MMKIEKMIFCFICGMIAGMMVVHALIVLAGREGAPGGEALILPFIILLITFGWQLHMAFIDGLKLMKKDKRG